MGAGSSTPASPPGGKAARGSRVSGLGVGGRYTSYAMPNGATVHVLGVFPCSTLCEEEAHDLIAAAKPSHLYIDLPPEWTHALQEEVAAGRVGDWKIPDTTPAFRFYKDGGLLGSILIRNALADNEMAGLMGGEIFGGFKAALHAAREAGTVTSVLSYPYSLSYNNGQMLDRPGQLQPFLLGDNSFTSTTVHGLVGNGVSILLGQPGEAEFTATIPPESGYFTREQVERVRRTTRERVNAAVTAKGADFDVEADLTRREAAAREEGKADDAASFLSAAVRAQIQSQAIAYSLRGAADEAGPGGNVVAIINLGTLASLKRNWEEARSPLELVPRNSLLVEASGYALPTVLLGSLGYLYYRGVRRFPRTFGAVGLLGAAAGSVMAWNLVYSDAMRYGTGVRAALARPRVVSSIARMDRAAGGR